MKSKWIEVLALVALTLVIPACSKESEQVQLQEGSLQPEPPQPEAQSKTGADNSIDSFLVSPMATQRPLTSILDMMQLVITPATDILWSVDDPQTDEDWSVFEQAALQTIEAAQRTALGGTGPQDSDWAADPGYQALNQLMLDAARSSLAAIQARDVDALLVAGDDLYAPCEACHLQFNPGVAGQ